MKEFFKKFIGFSLGPIIGAIIGFITVPIISHLVEAEQIGLANMFTLANTIITLVVMFGIDQAFMREYNETEDKKKLLLNSLLIPFGVSIVIGIILIIFRQQFASMLFNDTTSIEPIILLAVVTPLFIIEKFMLYILRMKEKAIQYSLWNILSKVLNLILVILLLVFYKESFESIIYATVLSELIVSVILLIICRKNISILKSYIDIKQIKVLLKFGLPLVPASLIGWGLNYTDTIFLRAMATYEEIGYYTVALKVSNILGLVQSSFTAFWTPLAFKWKANGEKNEKFELVSMGISLAMSIILILILLFKNILPVFFGDGYEAIIYILPFLLFHPIFYTMSETTILGIYFSKKTSYNIVISIISMTANIIMNWALIPKFGAIGAAVSTGVSYLIFFWTRTIISRKLWYKFDIKKFFSITIILTIVSLCNCIIKNIIIITTINIGGLILILITYKEILSKLATYIRNKI